MVTYSTENIPLPLDVDTHGSECHGLLSDDGECQACFETCLVYPHELAHENTHNMLYTGSWQEGRPAGRGSRDPDPPFPHSSLLGERRTLESKLLAEVGEEILVTIGSLAVQPHHVVGAP